MAVEKKSPWDISTISIKSVFSKQIPLDQYPYTILDTNNVYRDSQELAELYTATGGKTLPRNLVAFRPHRLAFQEIVAAIVTLIKLTGDTEEKIEKSFHEIIKTIVKESTPAISDITLELEKKRDALEKEIRNDVKKFLQKNLGEDSLYTQIMNETFKNLDTNIQTGTFVKNYSKEDVMVAIILDTIFTQGATKIIKELVANVIDNYLKENPNQAILPPAPEERYTFMVAGGSASGKGSSVVILEESVKQYGIDWSNVVKINTDRYKSLVLNPRTVKAEFFSQLAQDEASIIHQRIMKNLNEQQEKNIAPHVLVDQMFIGKDKLDFGLKNGGQVYIIVVSTEVADAVERSYQRGLKSNRFENIEVILRSHKNSTKEIPTQLNSYQGSSITMLIVDNNVPTNHQPNKVMKLNLKMKVLKIIDPEKLLTFVKKITINELARKPEEIYTSETVSTDSYLKPFRDVGINIIKKLPKLKDINTRDKPTETKKLKLKLERK